MNASPILEKYDALDRALVAAGFPPSSNWWQETFARFLKSGVRTLVIRKGRRAGGSTTICRMLVLLALWGGHHIPPGDVGVVAIISTSRDESAGRLRTIEAILTAIGIEYRRVGDTIEIVGRPVVFKTFTASIAGVSGFTAIAILCDECAKWRDADTGANPAKEVLASLRPTMATQPNARMFLSSSPLSTVDAHYEAFERGDSDAQITAYAPTWIANPTISEAQTHDLEPDERVWMREYRGLPTSAVSAAFDPSAVDRAFAPRSITGCALARPSLIIDPSSGRADTWAWAIVRWVKPYVEPRVIVRPVRTLDPFRHQIVESLEVVRDRAGNPIANPDYTDDPPQPFLRFEAIGGWEGRFFQQVRGDQIVAQLAALCRKHGITDVHSDQREQLMLEAAFSQQRLRLHVHCWTSESKPRAVGGVRRLLRDNAISFVEHAAMRTQLLQFEERITPSGSFTFGARGERHDDFVALALTASLADEAGLLPMSTMRTLQVVRSLVPGLVA